MDKEHKKKATFLTSLWVPDDFPCRPFKFRLINGQIVCLDCNRPAVKIGDSYYHPDTPALKAALERKNNESSVS